MGAVNSVAQTSMKLTRRESLPPQTLKLMDRRMARRRASPPFSLPSFRRPNCDDALERWLARS